MKNLTAHSSKCPINMSVFIILFTIIIGISLSCTNNLDNNKVSDDPINTAIIGIQSFPGSIFGNTCSEALIQVNTEIVPDGTPVEFKITNSNTLPPELRGCLFDSSGTVQDGLAFVNYLAGILVGLNATATVNIAVTIKPINGNEESEFISITLKGVSIGAPEALTVATGGSIVIDFVTFGLKSGTIITAEVGDESLGSVSPEETVVIGNEELGSFTLAYTATGEGVQIIILTAVLEFPEELIGICPIPPAEDLLIVVTVPITQTDAEPEPPPP